MKEKKIEEYEYFITGADGFFGSHLVQTLSEKSEVHGLVHLKDGEKPKNLDTDIDTYRGDITDPSSVRSFLERQETSKTPFILHLAAQSDVQRSWKTPLRTLRTNTLGTAQILEALKRWEQDSKILVAGTSEEYGNIDEDTLNEESCLRPESIYGSSKLSADFLCQNYCDRYDNISGATARFFNLYGPKQRRSCLTPTVICQAIKNEKVKLGNLQPKRDFLYVEDAVEAVKSYIKQGGKTDHERYVFGTGNPHSVEDWAHKILDTGAANNYWTQKVQVTQDKKRMREANEVTCLSADYNKAQENLGWFPKADHEESLLRTIEYYSKSARTEKIL